MRNLCYWLMIIACGCMISQCSKADGTQSQINGGMVQTPPPATIDTSGNRTFLALGDSYTIGQSVDDTLRFPMQAVSLMNKSGFNVSAPVFVARTGWSTIDLTHAIDRASLDTSYTYVTLLIGVNDEYQRLDDQSGGLDLADYTKRFATLLAKAITFAGGKANHVIVVSIPDYSLTPFVSASSKASVSARIEKYNQVNETTATAAGCKFLDIGTIYSETTADGTLIASDHLHPSGKEYGKWANLLEQYLINLP